MRREGGRKEGERQRAAWERERSCEKKNLLGDAESDVPVVAVEPAPQGQVPDVGGGEEGLLDLAEAAGQLQVRGAEQVVRVLQLQE